MVANGENAAGGAGITAGTAEEMLSAGVDVVTTGNHVWDQPGASDLLEEQEFVIRPLNYPPGTPGRGSGVFSVGGNLHLGVVNVQGRVFSDTGLDCPFRALDREVVVISRHTPAILVDFHAEATSEKQALANYLDGRVSAIVGTHTHVQTADARVLPGGTAYITDVGMTGPLDSVIGVRAEPVIRRFLTQMPVRHQVARGRVLVSMAVIDIGGDGKATAIRPHYSVHDAF